MIRPGARQVAAVIVLVGFALAVFALPQSTAASWSDSMNTSGSVTAVQVPKPTISTCNVSGGLFNPTITLIWTAPAGYSKTNAQFATQETVSGLPVMVPLAGNAVTTTGSISPFTSTYSTGFLTGLLGGSKTVGVRMVHPGSTWTGSYASATASMTILGFSLGCVIAP